jgi:CYTH domain
MGEPGNLETEIKFATDNAGLERALNSPLIASTSPFQIQNLRKLYFDTPFAELSKRKITIRIRKCAPTQNVLCFKLNKAANDVFFSGLKSRSHPPIFNPMSRYLTRKPKVLSFGSSMSAILKSISISK